MEKEKRTGPRAWLTLLFLMGMSVLVASFFIPAPGALRLVLTDSVFGSSLDGFGVTIRDGKSGRSLSTTVVEQNGIFLADFQRIRSGRAEVQVEVVDFEAQTASVQIDPMERAELKLLLEPTFGMLEVEAVDATSTKSVLGATVRVASRDGKEEAPPIEGGATLRLSLAPGEHSATGFADHYCPSARTAKVVKGSVTQLKLPLSSKLASDETSRIILDWGDSPRDLDSHLLVSQPSEAINGNHVFYGSLNLLTSRGSPLASLDVDYLNSEWFETVTVHDSIEEAVFQYFVHRYSPDGSLGTSSATVEVITRDCETRTFAVPVGCDERYWYVADLKATAEAIGVVPRMVCQESIPAVWRGQKAEGSGT